MKSALSSRLPARTSHSLERLESRIAPAVVAVRSGSAPNFTVTFMDDGTGVVDNNLILQFNTSTQNLEFSVNGGAFTFNLSGATASFANTSNIVVQLGDGENDALGINLQTFAFNVSTNPGSTTDTETTVFLTDSGTLHSVNLNLTGAQVLRLMGSGGNDALSVQTGQGDSTATVHNGATPFTDEVVASDYAVRLEYNNLSSFAFTASGTGTNTVTFSPHNLAGATSFSASLDGSDTLIIQGTENADSLTVTRPATGLAKITDGTLSVTLLSLGGTPGLQVNTLGGDDILNINVGATVGSNVIASNITFDGGTGTDLLDVFGSPTTSVTNVTYQPGLVPGEASLLYTDVSSTTLMSLHTVRTENVADLVVAGKLTVNGTDAPDQITYSATQIISSGGRISVGAAGTIEFSNKAFLGINGRGGSDLITLANTNLPPSLTSISVAGSSFGTSLGGGDSLVIVGSTGPETVSVVSNAADAATVSGLGPVLVNAFDIAALTLNGNGGGDNLTVTATMGDDFITLVPDAGAADAGTVHVNSLLPVHFIGLGAGSLSIQKIGGQDVFDYAGTADSDLFRVAATTGVITLGLRGFNGAFVPGSQHLPVSTDAQTLRLHGLEGNDLFQLGAALPYTGGVLTDGGPGQVDSSGQFGSGQAFTAPTNYDVGKSPAALVMGDLNGDGFLDLVTASGTSSSISVLLGTGDGGFQPALTFPTGGRSAHGLAIGNFDGDTTLDLAVTNLTGTVSILLGNGDGTFGTPTLFPAGRRPGLIRTADLDGDGHTDLAVLSDRTVAVLEGAGDGTFATPKLLPTGGLRAKDLLIADFNQDSNLDIVTANAGSNNISLITSKGEGDFNPAVKFPAGMNPMALATADINGDGHPDLIVAHGVSRFVSILLGKGNVPVNTEFQPQFRITTPGVSARAIAATDLDGDGRIDLAILNGAAGNFSVLLGAGPTSFRGPFTFSLDNTPPRNSSGFVIGDFDGDGRPDLAIANQGTSDVSVLLNTTG